MAAYLEGYGINQTKKTSTSPNVTTQPPTTTSITATKPFWQWGTGTAAGPMYSSYQAKQAAEALGSEGYGQDMAKKPAGSAGGQYTSWYAKQAAERLAAEEEARKKAERERRAEEARNAELERRFATLAAPAPETQQAYRQAVRDAQREFDMRRNHVQLGRCGARRDFRQGVRSVNREPTGQSTDLAEALAFLGMDTSPATMGVGLQDIERESDLARAELARIRAMTMGDLDAQMAQARIGRNRQLSAAEQALLAARAQESANLERYRMELFGQ